ncbi:MAG TPA: ATP-binding protein [Thermoleophilaceae bacterium]|nr:ATP-binding protein [Thermoleophilaceae bacterium]
MSDHRAVLEEYRDLREVLERSILSLATSVDGRRFEYQASLHELELEAGGYVAIDAGAEIRIGQVLSLRMERHDADGPDWQGTIAIRVARGEGALLEGDGRPFHDALVRPATDAEVSAWLERSQSGEACLEVGELALARGVPFALDAGGFGRHTFLCGQSGSGKTYSLGVLLEQLLMRTALRIVVLDPNSDYVRLGEPSPGADEESVERYRTAAGSIAVRSGTSGADGIRVRLRDLSPEHQASLLRLDPVADRGEYADLLALVEDEDVTSLEDLARSPAEALKLRAHNLGVDRWGIWPGPEGASLPEELEDDDSARCTVVDLGSLPTREEQAVVAGAVLERLWRQRARRRPVAIVIDEAHNICPAEPGDPLTALTTADAIRIAGEGRKFGLYLIVVTQRPQKVHENVLSQCDNLVLMRMNSLADLSHVARVFSAVPAGLIDRATTFAQGEALVSGKVASHPALIRFGSRISREGGTDVAGWA